MTRCCSSMFLRVQESLRNSQICSCEGLCRTGSPNRGVLWVKLILSRSWCGHVLDICGHSLFNGWLTATA